MECRDQTLSNDETSSLGDKHVSLDTVYIDDRDVSDLEFDKLSLSRDRNNNGDDDPRYKPLVVESVYSFGGAEDGDVSEKAHDVMADDVPSGYNCPSPNNLNEKPKTSSPASPWSGSSTNDSLVSLVRHEEDRIEYEKENYNYVSPSSGDETEEEMIQRARKSKCHRAHTQDDFKSKHNSNCSNNKKKSSQMQGARNGAKLRAVNFRLSQEQRRQNHMNDANMTPRNERFNNKGRFHSVQLSSIRAMPAAKGNKSSTWVSQKIEYGQRLIEKHGSSNVLITNIDKVDLMSRYFNDIFTTLLDSSWAWVLFITTSVYITHWAIFGLFYWIFAIVNEDYTKIMGAGDSNGTSLPQEDPCVYQVYDGVSAFLFSLESETTIGYGYRTISTACPHVVIFLTFQCIVSAIFDTWVIGMCFSRMARPDARSITTLFSTKAVICRRDGKRYLIVRFANLRKSLLLNVSVRARLITLRGALTKEINAGYQRMLEQRQVTFENASSALLTAPIEYRHLIDKDSPFYRIRPDLFGSSTKENFFELVCIVTGTLESTGLTMQAQTSYLSSEIMNGHRFAPIISKSYDRGKYVVDFKHFHVTTEEPSPTKPAPRETIYVKKNKSSTDSRGTSVPPLHDTEDELISASDDVFLSDGCGSPRMESVV